MKKWMFSVSIFILKKEYFLTFSVSSSHDALSTLSSQLCQNILFVICQIKSFRTESFKASSINIFCL